MTLIVSVISPDYVVQLSDRRVTLLHRDGRREIRAEPQVKAVVFCNRAVFGFTGLVELAGKRTDLWIAAQLKEVDDLGDGFDRLRRQLTRVFDRVRNRGIGHTVTAAGYKLEPDGSLTPYYAVVTNQFDQGRWVEAPLREFKWFVELSPPGSVGVFAAPGWLSETDIKELREDIAAMSSLDDVIARVVHEIRKVASTHDEVGEDLMLATLPRAGVSATGPTMLLTGGGILPDIPTFFYLPTVGSSVQYGPTFVCGGSIMSNFEVRYGQRQVAE